jgi:tRNA (cmo5U34)-methyltransferase
MDNATPHQAANYDQDVRQTIPFYAQFHAETLDLVQTIQPTPAVWLDTGCGTGAMVAAALTLFPTTHFVLADPAEKMLAIARSRFQELPATRVTVLPPAGTEQLVWTTDLFAPNIITAIQAHHYLSRVGRQQATQRCFELLASQGVYITFENICPDSVEGISIGLDRWQRFQRAQGKDAAIVAAHAKRFNTAYFPIRVIEHLELLRQCGFRVVEMFWYAYMQAGFYAIK